MSDGGLFGNADGQWGPVEYVKVVLESRATENLGD